MSGVSITLTTMPPTWHSALSTLLHPSTVPPPSLLLLPLASAVSHQEDIQVLRYEQGQNYGPHQDSGANKDDPGPQFRECSTPTAALGPKVHHTL